MTKRSTEHVGRAGDEFGWLQRVSTISWEAAIRPSDGTSTNKEVIPQILTYNPANIHVKNILTKNFELLKSDPETMEIFRSSRVLDAYRRDSNLKDSLVHINPQSSMNTGDDSNGTFPSLQRVSTISWEAVIWQSDGASTNKEVIPLILTYNPTNIHGQEHTNQKLWITQIWSWNHGNLP